jgi:hypothetical protein
MRPGGDESPRQDGTRNVQTPSSAIFLRAKCRGDYILKKVRHHNFSLAHFSRTQRSGLLQLRKVDIETGKVFAEAVGVVDTCLFGA